MHSILHLCTMLSCNLKTFKGHLSWSFYFSHLLGIYCQFTYYYQLAYILVSISHIIINYILVSISSDLLNKTDIKWLNLSVAEVISHVLLEVDDVFVAHTLVPCAPFTPRRASAGALTTSRVHITGSLRYWRLIGCYTKF